MVKLSGQRHELSFRGVRACRLLHWVKNSTATVYTVLYSMVVVALKPLSTCHVCRRAHNSTYIPHHGAAESGCCILNRNTLIQRLPSSSRRGPHRVSYLYHTTGTYLTLQPTTDLSPPFQPRFQNKTNSLPTMPWHEVRCENKYGSPLQWCFVK